MQTCALGMLDHRAELSQSNTHYPMTAPIAILKAISYNTMLYTHSPIAPPIVWTGLDAVCRKIR